MGMLSFSRPPLPSTRPCRKLRIHLKYAAQPGPQSSCPPTHKLAVLIAATYRAADGIQPLMLAIGSTSLRNDTQHQGEGTITLCSFPVDSERSNSIGCPPKCRVAKRILEEENCESSSRSRLPSELFCSHDDHKFASASRIGIRA